MTALKQQAIDMIKQMPEEQIIFVISFIKNAQNSLDSETGDIVNDRAAQAFRNLQRLSRKGTVTDDKSELEKALWEKYESIS